MPGRRVNTAHKHYVDLHEEEDGKIAVYKTVRSKTIWHYRIYVGAEKRYVTKSARTETFQDALGLAREKFYEAKIAKREGATSKLWAMPFDDTVDKYLAWYAKQAKIDPKKEGPLARITAHFVHWKGFLGSTALHDIMSDQLDEYPIWRNLHRPKLLNGTEKPLAMTTFSLEYGSLSGFFEWCIKRKFLRSDDKPEHSFSLKKKDKRRRPWFTPEEWRKVDIFLLMQQSPKYTANPNHRKAHEQLYMFCSLIIASGLRPGEAYKLQWRDISWHGKHIKLRVIEDNKTGYREVICLQGAWETAVAARQRLKPKPEHYIFHAGDPTKRIYNLEAACSNALKGCGMLLDREGNKRTIYSMRHTYATNQLNDNVSPYILAKKRDVRYDRLWHGHSGRPDRNRRSGLGTGLAAKGSISGRLKGFARTQTNGRHEAD